MTALSTEDWDVVRRTPLFSDIPEDELKNLVKDARLHKYPRGGMLFVRGDPVDKFFLLLDGWVKVFRDTAEGEQSVVAVMKPGESFAQAAIFTGKSVFPASAEIVDEARVLEIPAGPFLKRLKEDSSLSLKMLASVSQRLLQLVQHIEQLQFRSTAQRLAAFLVDLTDQEEGPATLRLPYDKSLIAARLGMKPESLSRAIAKLRKQGVTTSGSTVQVDDIGELRIFAHADEDD